MDQIKIGSLLKTLRKEKGVTQEQLAERLGVTNRSVSRWETGANLPDFDLLMELASNYEIGIDEFFEWVNSLPLGFRQTGIYRGCING